MVRLLSVGLLVSMSAGATAYRLGTAGGAARDLAQPDFLTPIGGPFELVDTQGRVVTDADYGGRWMLVFFGYTGCGEACPPTLQTVTDGVAKLGPLADEVVPLFITVDPARDTPARMAIYLENFDRRIVGLTGSDAQVAQAAKSYRVFYSASEREGSGADSVSRAKFLYLVAPNGKFDELLPADGDSTALADSLAARVQAKSET